jgi:hypothetical protein
VGSGATVNTPGASVGTGAGASGGAAVDTQSAQQPGVGIDSGASTNGTIASPPRR